MIRDICICMECGKGFWVHGCRLCYHCGYCLDCNVYDKDAAQSLIYPPTHKLGNSLIDLREALELASKTAKQLGDSNRKLFESLEQGLKNG